MNHIVEIKKPWNGMVAIRDKIVLEAQRDGKAVEFRIGKESMVIPHDQLTQKIIRRAGPFDDKFSQNKHYLWYYSWKPVKNTVDNRQHKMTL